MKTKRYFLLQLKKASKHYPAIIAINILLIVCITVSCMLIINKKASSDEMQKLKVGIVGDLTHTYLDVGITAIQNLDSSRFSVELITYDDEDTAKDKLKSGELTGYIRVPDGFVSSLINMDNIPISYVSNNGPVGLGSILVTEVASTISNTVVETQRGVYGLQRLAKTYTPKESVWRLTDKINAKYILSVLNRTNTFETEYVGVSDGLSTGGYFVCGGIMMFLLLWGISCSSILIKKDRSLDKLLFSKGQSLFSQTLSEYIVFFLITLVTFIIFATILGTVLQFYQCGIKEIDYKYLTDYIMYIIGIIPVLLMITSLQFLFYELVSGSVSVILIQFIFAIGTGYICGCLYPSHYFPVSIQNFAHYLPTGFGVTYMRQLLSDSLSFESFLGTSLYFIAFFLLSIAIRKHRNAGDYR